MHAEMAKIARTIKIRDKLVSAAIHANRTFIRTTTADTVPLDPKIEWPLIADYDVD